MTHFAEFIMNNQGNMNNFLFAVELTGFGVILHTIFKESIELLKENKRIEKELAEPLQPGDVVKYLDLYDCIYVGPNPDKTICILFNGVALDVELEDIEKEVF